MGYGPRFGNLSTQGLGPWIYISFTTNKTRQVHESKRYLLWGAKKMGQGLKIPASLEFILCPIRTHAGSSICHYALTNSGVSLDNQASQRQRDCRQYCMASVSASLPTTTDHSAPTWLLIKASQGTLLGGRSNTLPWSSGAPAPSG